eukprot:CAMPEP_0185279888 /NCGR_PEP_ID=MMETSP1359-20130426/64696_1 /TAXON_ID=552665 /ORGANISM="Bigelowiella longifila, Strain CCMP242" /LENGTH=278 /DNA_ID=CAMNT_0027874915 /DNA_START=93 /DNA_END=925 /DNA_ORIENTATION=+
MSKWSGDSRWYKAVVKQVIKPRELYRVHYEGFGDEDDEERKDLYLMDVREFKNVPAVGEELSGNVTSLHHFGAFVDFGGERDGLVHVSQMLEPKKHALHAADLLRKGQKVRCKVTSYRSQGRMMKVTLSMLGISGNCLNKTHVVDGPILPKQDQEGTICRGRVVGVTNAGVFVRVAGYTRDAFVPGRSLTEEQKEALKIEAIVLAKLDRIDNARQRTTLSLNDTRCGVIGTYTQNGIVAIKAKQGDKERGNGEVGKSIGVCEKSQSQSKHARNNASHA